MPQVNYTLNLKDVLSPQTRMVLELAVTQINLLRQAAGLPQLTEAQVKHAVRQYIAQHPDWNWVHPRPGGG